MGASDPSSALAWPLPHVSRRTGLRPGSAHRFETLSFTMLGAADPLLVIRRHVDFLRIGSAICLPRPLTTARHS
jgi:hypothetical protein